MTGWKSKLPSYLTSVRGQNGVEFCQVSTGHVRFFLALLLLIGWDSQWHRMTLGWFRMRARGEGWGGLFLGRFYFSKWLTFPVLGHKKVLVFNFVYQIYLCKMKCRKIRFVFTLLPSELQTLFSSLKISLVSIALSLVPLTNSEIESLTLTSSGTNFGAQWD